MRKIENKTGNRLNEKNEGSNREKELLHLLLMDFLDYRNLCRNVSSDGKISLEQERDSQMDILIKKYVLEHFTFRELFIAFVAASTNDLSEANIEKYRQYSIAEINESRWLTPNEKKRLKRKLWDMNLILYGFVNQFVMIFIDFFINEYSNYNWHDILQFPEYELRLQLYELSEKID